MTYRYEQFLLKFYILHEVTAVFLMKNSSSNAKNLRSIQWYHFQIVPSDDTVALNELRGVYCISIQECTFWKLDNFSLCLTVNLR